MLRAGDRQRLAEPDRLPNAQIARTVGLSRPTVTGRPDALSRWTRPAGETAIAAAAASRDAESPPAGPKAGPADFLHPGSTRPCPVPIARIRPARMKRLPARGKVPPMGLSRVCGCVVSGAAAGWLPRRGSTVIYAADSAGTAGWCMNQGARNQSRRPPWPARILGRLALVVPASGGVAFGAGRSPLLCAVRAQDCGSGCSGPWWRVTTQVSQVARYDTPHPPSGTACAAARPSSQHY